MSEAVSYMARAVRASAESVLARIKEVDSDPRLDHYFSNGGNFNAIRYFLNGETNEEDKDNVRMILADLMKSLLENVLTIDGRLVPELIHHLEENGYLMTVVRDPFPIFTIQLKKGNLIV